MYRSGNIPYNYRRRKGLSVTLIHRKYTYTETVSNRVRLKGKSRQKQQKRYMHHQQERNKKHL